MRKSLRKFLLDKGYTRVKLNRINTNHYEVKAKINGVEGSFILDTGASTSCVGFEAVKIFKLKAKDSTIKAAGAGAVNMETQIAKSNKIRIGKWKKQRVALVLFNLDHVNTALTQHEAEPVHGIIGADILRKGKAVIDYDKNCLYLK
ncbi:acid protease [Kordia sp. TARA_039_SRF]|jgi:predicted aspartyl protease|uniref:retropepsin-like aspartic protease n=1 Tax=Kordia periserrulae TaxID=701523 RepID=UPI000D36CFD8|nr:retropepsin-like aspartic protease [Kordia periserrulae]KAB8154452.1 acid protease [Kordia sp. TARA_039_SRF]